MDNNYIIKIRFQENIRSSCGRLNEWKFFCLIISDVKYTAFFRYNTNLFNVFRNRTFPVKLSHYINDETTPFLSFFFETNLNSFINDETLQRPRRNEKLAIWFLTTNATAMKF